MLLFDAHASFPHSPHNGSLSLCMCNAKEIPDAKHIQVMMIKIHLLFCLKLDKMLCGACFIFFFKSTLTLSLKLRIKDKGICLDVFGV